MRTLFTFTMLAAVSFAAAGLQPAKAEEHCRMEKQCRWENYKKICTYVKVCRDR